MKKRIRLRITLDTARFIKLPRFSFDRSHIANFRLWTFDWLWFGAWMNAEDRSQVAA